LAGIVLASLWPYDKYSVGKDAHWQTQLLPDTCKLEMLPNQLRLKKYTTLTPYHWQTQVFKFFLNLRFIVITITFAKMKNPRPK